MTARELISALEAIVSTYGDIRVGGVLGELGVNTEVVVGVEDGQAEVLIVDAAILSYYMEIENTPEAILH